jgi:transposase
VARPAPWIGFTGPDIELVSASQDVAPAGVIGGWQRREAECLGIAAIPGVGILSATAAVGTVGDAKTFRSGREFAAFLGLVPRQSGTGGRVKLLGISKRGDPYLRTLLIHGARSGHMQQSRR